MPISTFSTLICWAIRPSSDRKISNRSRPAVSAERALLTTSSASRSDCFAFSSAPSPSSFPFRKACRSSFRCSSRPRRASCRFLSCVSCTSNVMPRVSSVSDSLFTCRASSSRVVRCAVSISPSWRSVPSLRSKSTTMVLSSARSVSASTACFPSRVSDS